jgi:CheY-like chemotaxis protein
MTPVTVLLADDHSIVVERLRRVLEPTFTVVGAVPDGRALVTRYLIQDGRVSSLPRDEITRLAHHRGVSSIRDQTPFHPLL